MVELGHALGLKVIAEGVETDAQLAQLRELGCDGAQGYLFGQPVPEEERRRLLAPADGGSAARGSRRRRRRRRRSGPQREPVPRNVRISGGSPSLRRSRVT